LKQSSEDEGRRKQARVRDELDTAHLRPSFSIEKAHRTQIQLSSRISPKDMMPRNIQTVAGVDVAYVQDTSIGATVLLDYSSMKVLEKHTALSKTVFPYIPTLLSFREIPPAVLSAKKLQTEPDVFLVDGHGLAHPYKCGFACHFGLVLNKPTIGVAKKRLFGLPEETESSEGVRPLKHEGQVVGATVETKKGCTPIYVSIGHMVSLETAIRIVRNCIYTSRTPEPIWKAHTLASQEKQKINIASKPNR